jgi:hypothetical protein
VAIDADFERSGGRCTALRFSSRTEFAPDSMSLSDVFNDYFLAEESVELEQQVQSNSNAHLKIK